MNLTDYFITGGRAPDGGQRPRNARRRFRRPLALQLLAAEKIRSILPLTGGGPPGDFAFAMQLQKEGRFCFIMSE